MAELRRYRICTREQIVRGEHPPGLVMAKGASFEGLTNELIKDILDHIESDPEWSVNIDRRAYLSVESFRLPSPPIPPRAQDIGNFRLVCSRFAELGAPYQWTRVATRLSPSGLRRLDNICGSSHLARHTKKFSYLVPFFYAEGKICSLSQNGEANLTNGQGQEHVEEILHHATNGVRPSLDASWFKNRADDQRRIVESGEDVRVLTKAMTAFTSLQHVQILRLQDEADRLLLDFLQEIEGTDAPRLQLKWTPACVHASKTVGEALMESRSPFSRFSGPMMNTEAALAVKNSIPQTVTFLASCLACLELHFDDGPFLDDSMRQLSAMFRTVFSAAKNLQALHIGFPSRLPISLKLEDIFHHVRWEKLRAFGIQAWHLESSEIINLARRHSRTLRGLRLRDVHLKEGSMWKDVLAMLRAEMEQLDWVSLRRVDYSKHFDEMWAGGMEVIDEPPAGASDSDDENDFPDRFSIPDQDDGASDDDASDEHSDADTDHGPDANELALSLDTPVSLPFCTCSRTSYPASADELGDNGLSVVYHQRKMWEKWVVGRCPEHALG